MAEGRRLGVGFIGSGFITRFHIRSWVGVRDADVRGVWSPNPGRAEEAAALARSLRVGEAKAFASIEAMVAAAEIDCIWICGPNGYSSPSVALHLGLTGACFSRGLPIPLASGTQQLKLPAN